MRRLLAMALLLIVVGACKNGETKVAGSNARAAKKDGNTTSSGDGNKGNGGDGGNQGNSGGNGGNGGNGSKGGKGTGGNANGNVGGRKSCSQCADDYEKSITVGGAKSGSTCKVRIEYGSAKFVDFGGGGGGFTTTVGDGGTKATTGGTLPDGSGSSTPNGNANVMDASTPNDSGLALKGEEVTPSTESGGGGSDAGGKVFEGCEFFVPTSVVSCEGTKDVTNFSVDSGDGCPCSCKGELENIRARGEKIITAKAGDFGEFGGTTSFGGDGISSSDEIQGGEGGGSTTFSGTTTGEGGGKGGGEVGGGGATF